MSLVVGSARSAREREREQRRVVERAATATSSSRDDEAAVRVVGRPRRWWWEEEEVQGPCGARSARVAETGRTALGARQGNLGPVPAAMDRTTVCGAGMAVHAGRGRGTGGGAGRENQRRAPLDAGKQETARVFLKRTWQWFLGDP